MTEAVEVAGVVSCDMKGCMEVHWLAVKKTVDGRTRNGRSIVLVGEQ